MTLLTEGYFPSTFWAENYWNDWYWCSYGITISLKEILNLDSYIYMSISKDSEITKQTLFYSETNSDKQIYEYSIIDIG